MDLSTRVEFVVSQVTPQSFISLIGNVGQALPSLSSPAALIAI